MSRTTAVEEQEGDNRAAGQVDVYRRPPPPPPPPMRSMSREDSCASTVATNDNDRNAKAARILCAYDVWGLHSYIHCEVHHRSKVGYTKKG